MSIIMPMFNSARFVGESIASVQSQTYTNWELIVIDDGSTDNSIDLLHEYYTEITVIKNSTNKGIAAASNAGLYASTAPYWMRVDADDYLSAEACSHMGVILDNNPEIDFVYCDHIRVDVHGMRAEYVRLDTEKQLYRHGAGILFRKSRLLEIGGYDEEFKNAEDYDLLVRLKKIGSNGFYLPVPLYRYYIHGGNMTLTDDRKKYWKKVKEKHGI